MFVEIQNKRKQSKQSKQEPKLCCNLNNCTFYMHLGVYRAHSFKHSVSLVFKFSKA